MTNSLPTTLLRFFWHFAKKYRWQIFIIQLLCSAWSIDHTLWPYVMMLIIDGITNYASDKAEMWQILSTPIIMGICLFIGIESAHRIYGFIWAWVLPRLEADVRLSMFNYVQHHSFQYFSSHFSGSISNKISDMTQSMTRILQLFMMLFMPVMLALIISLSFFAWVHYTFALILGSWLFVHFAICIGFSAKCDRLSDIHAESRSSLAGKIVDSLSNSLNVRLFARYPYELSLLKTAQEDERKKHQTSLVFVEKMKVFIGLAYLLIPAFGLNAYMLWSWQHEYITTGEVVFIFNTSWNIGMMAWIAGMEMPGFFKEIGVCKQALSIIRDAHGVVDQPQAKKLEVKEGSISFHNVHFAYHPERPIFQNLSVTIPAHQKVGLVGFSGSGKSTFVSLILRYFDIQQGSIRVDGQEINTITQNSLRSQISMIPQDTSLFHRTLFENIGYGKLDASEDEIKEAARLAHCAEFIEDMPEGYSSLVGERGVKLSGGQRQRIAIARAILKNAKILILDEATSSLDSVTEQQIQEGFNLLMQGRTTIVIAHRLSTLLGMDRILVFREGQIVEDGAHVELLATKGYYHELWQMQAGGVIDTEE